MSGNHTYQYEPLPVPSQWGREERQFISRLTDVLDDIYLKWGRISERELSAALRKKIDSKADGSDLESYSTIEQTAEAIRTEVSQIRVGGRNLLLGTTVPLSASAAGPMGSYERADSELMTDGDMQLHFDFTVEGGGSASLTVNLGDTPVVFSLSGESDHAWAAVRLNVDDWTEAEFVLSDPTGPVTISHVQLETGTTPTQWGQADGELIAGSEVEITKDNVRICTPRFSVGYGGDEYMALDMNGGYFPRLSSPQTAPQYDGPDHLYVNAGAADGKTYFPSLGDALEAVNGHWLSRDVTVQASSKAEYQPVELRGVGGNGSVIIEGGGIMVYNGVRLVRCSVPVEIRNASILHSDVALEVDGCSYVLAERCIMETTGDTAVVSVNRGSTARLTGCAMAAGNFSLRAWNGSRVAVYNCRGDQNMCSQAAFVIGSGTLPSGSDTEVTVTAYQNGYISVSGTPDRGSGAGTVTGGSDAPVTGNTILASATGYHQSVWNSGGGYFYQGYTSPYGAITGCMWFDMSAFAGKTAVSGKLRLSRVSGYGGSGTVKLRLMGLGTGCTGVGTTMNRVKNYGVIGSIAPGATKHFTLPVSAVQELIDGTIGGLCLFAADSQVLTGLSYSENYARFYGTAGSDDTKPRLSITTQ